MASASAFGRRLFSQVARPAARVASRSGASTTRRLASTSAEHAHAPGSDRAWQIGSALVFGPALIYLLTPSKKSAHEPAKHHAPSPAPAVKTEVPTKDDEGTEVPKEEVVAAVSDAVTEDSPKDAQAAEEDSAKFDNGAPAQTSEAEEKPDQQEKPAAKEETEAEAETKEQPTDVGEARSEAKEGEAPKEAEEKKEQEH